MLILTTLLVLQAKLPFEAVIGAPFAVKPKLDLECLVEFGHYFKLLAFRPTLPSSVLNTVPVTLLVESTSTFCFLAVVIYLGILLGIVASEPFLAVIPSFIRA